MSGVGERGLGMELRKFRERAGMTCQEVGAVLGWSANTVSRLERGLRLGTRPEDVSALLAAMRVTGAERDMTMQMANGHREQGWWEGNDTSLSDQARTYMELEARATKILNVEPLLVPGLLQTPDYYRALMTGFGDDPLQMNDRIAKRMGRQAILGSLTHPAFTAIVSEVALRQPVGGGSVMARQLRKIISASALPNVTVLVVPAAVAAHPGLYGAFVVLEFGFDRPVVFIEGRLSGLFPESEPEFTAYRLAAKRQAELALDPQRSLEALHAIAEHHEK